MSCGLILIAILGCGLGCKKVDNDAPSVALSSPIDGFSIVADSEFVIAGITQDDQGLASVTAILYETTTEVVVQTQALNVSGLRNDFSFKMAAGDRYTPAGNYTLKVSGLDGAGNIGSAFTQVSVQALPLVYLGAYWAGTQGSSGAAIHALDTAGVVHTGPSGLVSLTDLLADNRNGQLVAVQSVPGTMRAWAMDGLDPVFQYDLPLGVGTETFTGISMNRRHYYTSLQAPSYLRRNRFDGVLTGSFDEALHPGTAILATSDHVYMGLQGVLGTPTKLDAYDVNGGYLQATLLTDWPIMEICEIDDAQLLVVGNLGSQGQITVVDRLDLGATWELSLNESIVDAVTANGRVWILTDQGLYEYFPGTGNLSGQLVGGNYTALGVDATLNRVLLGSLDQVELRSGAGALITTYAGAYGQVQFIETRYNK